jgi:transcription elongation factor Elf1
MLYIDIKYANLLSTRLEQFKVKKTSPYLANCRCPFCGDSDWSKRKARGYVMAKKDRVLFYCHNCGTSVTIGSLLKEVNPTLYNEYRLETFAESRGVPVPEVVDANPLERFRARMLVDQSNSMLLKFSELGKSHPARKYLAHRKIPESKWDRLRYAPGFVEWTNLQSLPSELKMKEHPRLVMPLLDRNGRMFGYQGRSFDPKESLRYITIMLDTEQPKLFGLDKIDEGKPVYVLEGPLDSLFVENSLAMAGADVSYDHLPKNSVFVYDNEPRSKAIVKKIERCISDGYSVVIFPSTVNQKDINDMVLDGLKSCDVQSFIENNTYQGIDASVALREWKRV